MNKFEKLLEERGVDYTLADSTTEFEDLANKLRTKMSLQKYIYGILGFVIFPLFSICNIYYLLVCETELGKVMKFVIIASLLVISFLYSLLAIIEAKSLKSQYENRKYYKFDGRKISYYKFISLIYKDVSTFAAKFKNDGKDVIERRKSKQIRNEIKRLQEKEENILNNVFPTFEELSDLYDIDNGSETGLTSNLLSEMFRFLRTPCTLRQVERQFKPFNFADSILKELENEKRISAFTFSNSIGFVFRWDSKTISLLTHKFSDAFEPEKEKYRKEISFLQHSYIN